jgi:DNA end-binding protein Ku
MKAPFDISDYKDRYTAQLLKFIENKAKGKKVAPVKTTKKIPEDVSDLLAQLKASLGGEKTPVKKSTAKKTSPAKKAPARRRKKAA